MKQMAKVVDEQNKDDKEYTKMSENFEKSIAFKTACDLFLRVKNSPQVIQSLFYI